MRDVLDSVDWPPIRSRDRFRDPRRGDPARASRVGEGRLPSVGGGRRVSPCGGKRAGARRVFCQVAVRGLECSGAEVARFLGVTTSSVTRLAVLEELPEVRQYVNALTLFQTEPNEKVNIVATPQ